MVDFKKYLKKKPGTEPKDPYQVSLGCPVIAIDSGGNHHGKDPFLYTRYPDNPEKTILSFGGFCEYYLSDKDCGLLRTKKYQDRIEKIGLCIDAGGRNHSGYGEVRISGKDMRKLFILAEKLRSEIESK